MQRKSSKISQSLSKSALKRYEINPDVSRVLPLPQWFKATEKSMRNVTFKLKSKQSLTLHARADFEKFIRTLQPAGLNVDFNFV